MSFSLTITPDSPAQVTVTPPGNITYGQPLGTPSATATVGGKPLTDAKFAFTYKGIDGTSYQESTVPPTDAGRYQVTATLTTLGYSGSGTAGFTISRAGSTNAKAYIYVPNGQEKKISINETFIFSGMAKGAKIKAAPVIAVDGKLIKSCDAQVGESQFTLKLKNDAPNGSRQAFSLVLESDNYTAVTVDVTVYNDNVVVIGAKLKDGKTEFPSGTALENIVDLKSCAATVNGSAMTGTFELMDPKRKPKEGLYKDWSVSVLFTTNRGTKYQVSVSVPEFTINAAAGGNEETDDIYLKNGYFITIYANSQYNQSKESLLKLVQERKGSYTFNGTTHKAAWSADSGNRAFKPKGYEENVWYNYTAALEGSSQRPHAHVRVIPVNATSLNFNTSTSSKTVKASDVNALTEQDWKDSLGLPAMVIFKNKPAQEVDAAFLDKRDEFPINDPQSGCYTTNSPITGWKMDGKDLTLTALKSKAASTVNGDVVVTLTPVYQAMGWVTVKGSAPAFQLTITPKIPVDVKWDDGPASPITYGEMLNLGTPGQVSKDGGSIDETTGFSWQYIYYKEDGTRLGQMQPTNVGIYKVQAVLISRTHSGASVLKEFEIKAKSIDGAGVTFTPPADIGSLTYNKRPQTPVYTVKDGEKALRQNTDYRVSYRDNTNAGTAKVTFTGMGNYTGTTEKTFTIQKLPLTADQKPVISGTAASGQVLSASLDGVDAAELEWSWTVTNAAGTNSTVVGDNTASYEVRPEDSNKIINVTAKAKDSGNYSGISGASDGKLVEKLKVAGIVTVTAAHTDADGRIEVGTILTANASVIPSNVPAGFWQWKVNGTIKEHNVNNTYTVESGDKDIIAVFVPVPDYTGSIESAAVEVGRILLSGTVSATKDPADSHPIAVGSRLKASVNSGTASGIFTYTWLRDGKPISGADGEEYTVIAADRGKTISVKVTADGYTGELVSGGINVPAARPGAPTNVKVNAGDQLLDISWNDPADNGGAPVTGYRLKVMQGANVVLERVLAENVLSYKLEGLTNGAEYIVSVQAFNRIGDGEVCEATGMPRVSGEGGNGNAGGNGNGDTGGSGNGYIGGNGNGYTGGGKTGKATGTPRTSGGGGGDGKVGITPKMEQNGRIFTHTNDEKSTDPEKPTDGISHKRNGANFILSLTILGISGIGMMIALLDKRRKYREKLSR